jgi:2-methylcitrate dehydratase PrpD
MVGRAAEEISLKFGKHSTTAERKPSELKVLSSDHRR